ncbi:cupin domain-containing protein [Testudinibacter sp. TR-2022]|uniref:ribosomal protein uL16 3-hydroxylase n=1 Tax=Testudinibacter sp. TR-2022 TaxID=2585029 RepID=UPI00111A288D|nr:cupin domain-containing protein [Testudinibacter sp. TR-2022]TNH04281.1 cupin domain-containing protein [Pasteurellaceae bacterium Phil31]TNH10112.1 cupin domain-containing protein [Testudinibacter sp. TR-2022]TNH10747.1 cupin domain-containing protein [Testudinibacter sp. TR-2022]TNH14776.1 cupin domain-containing protein [Testudinibacter sp. TR-2022]TNH16286.1 cupin domain-containing protein [Testudinibacter sp. TR-2022]
MSKIAYCLPNEISAEQFLTEYWQKKPLLIKNGLPQIVGLLEPQDIIDLAQQDDVTARLLKTEQDPQGEERWTLKTSPLNKKDFSKLPPQWSVLVQNLEQWSPELGELWQAFGFIPQWQRDDIMVSYAPQGGSVGRHYDEYDVFLVQAYGHRRWQLGKWCDPSTEFKPNQPIRIFDEMGDLLLDEVMAPGDVLYVPSRLSHYGVAQDDCLTVSFGLRYPNLGDLIDNINDAICHPTPHFSPAALNIPLRLSPNTQPLAQLDPAMVQNMKQQLLDHLSQSAEFDRLFQHAVATAVSSRRYELLQSDDEFYPEELSEMLQDGATIQQDSNSKMLYTEQPFALYVNGEWLDELSELESAVLKDLANGAVLDWQTLQGYVTDLDDEMAEEVLLDSLCSWLENGWLVLGE